MKHSYVGILVTYTTSEPQKQLDRSDHIQDNNVLEWTAKDITDKSQCRTSRRIPTKIEEIHVSNATVWDIESKNPEVKRVPWWPV